ncbi:MAG: tetratricopeptide repeat protein [Saprospiraceae bacterium]
MSILSTIHYCRAGVLILWLLASFQFLSAQTKFSAEKYFKKAEDFKKNMMPDSAIFYFKKAALHFKEKGKTKKLINTYNQIATLLSRKDKFEEGRMYLGMAELAGNTLKDTNDLLRAATFINLGVIYGSMGDFKGSLAYHRRALAIRLLKSGEYNSDVATSYGNMGNVYFIQKEYDLAIESHLKALKIREKIFGSKSTEVNQTYNNLAKAYKEKKEYDTALTYLQKLEENKILQVGPDHKDLIKVYTSLSDLYQLMGNDEQMVLYKSKADAISAKVGG